MENIKVPNIIFHKNLFRNSRNVMFGQPDREGSALLTFDSNTPHVAQTWLG